VQEKKPSRLFYIPWMAFLPFYMIYESAINIYFFYMAFSARVSNGGTFIVRPYGVSIFDHCVPQGTQNSKHLHFQYVFLIFSLFSIPKSASYYTG